MADLPLPPKKPGEFRLAHLSDVHVTHEGAGSLQSRVLRLLRRDDHRNGLILRGVVRDILSQEIDHVVVTGDITQTGRRSEFAEARRILAPLEEAGRLTVIPGNHDITYRREDRSGRLLRRLAKLDPFLEHFGDVIPKENPFGLPMRRGRPFPFVKILQPGGIALVGIDTTSRWGTHVQPFNSLGHVDRPQREALERILRSDALASFTRVVLMHHHPMIIPLFHRGEGLRRLRRSSWLMPLFYENRVHLVLHGHKHVPFCWQSNAYRRHQITVVCAAPPNALGAFSGLDDFPLVYNVYGIGGGDVAIRYREFTFRMADQERAAAL